MSNALAKLEAGQSALQMQSMFAESTSISRMKTMTKALFEKNPRLSILLLALALTVLVFTGGYLAASAGLLPALTSRAPITADDLRLLADANDPVAQNKLGIAYRNGTYGLQQDFQQASYWFTKAAEQGLSDAQNSLGNLYEDGTGVPQDPVKAMELYRKAAEAGQADAQANMGRMYQIGTAVKPEIAKAVEWYRKAADQGHAGAQFNLGNLYRDGRGVTQSYEQAAKLYVKAADEGNFGPAQNNLARMFAEGLGVKQDYAKAGSYYRLAEQNGEHKVTEFLEKSEATCLASSGSVEAQDVPDCLVAAGAGNAKSQAIIGALYDSGMYLPKNEGEALLWNEKAALGGELSSQLILFVRYGQAGEHSREALMKSYAWLLLLERSDASDARFRALARQFPAAKEKYEARLTRREIDEATALSIRYAAEIEINTKEGR